MPSPSASPTSALDAAIAALIGARHRDPFAVLGPHRDAGAIVVRAFQPAARTMRASARGHGRAVADDEARSGGVVRGPPRSGRSRGRPRLSASRHVSGRPRGRDRRSVPLRPRADRLRSASARRGDPSPRLREARLASHHRRDDDRRALRGLGAERGARQPHRRLQRVGRPRPSDAFAGARRHLGDLRPGSAGRRKVQVRDPDPHRRDPQEGRSVRARVRGAAAVRGRRARHLGIRVARRRAGSPPAPANTPGSIGR